MENGYSRDPTKYYGQVLTPLFKNESYKVIIENNYNVTRFNGTKSFIMSTKSQIGK